MNIKEEIDKQLVGYGATFWSVEVSPNMVYYTITLESPLNVDGQVIVNDSFAQESVRMTAHDVVAGMKENIDNYLKEHHG